MRTFHWFLLSLIFLGGLGLPSAFADSPTPEELPLLSGKDLRDKIKTAKGPVVLDFWATWCAPCKIFSPVVTEVSKKYEGQMEFYRVDVSAKENDKMAKDSMIEAIPTLVVYEKGKMVARWMGIMTKPNLQKHLDKILADWQNPSSK